MPILQEKNLSHLYSNENEMMVLGCMLTNNNALETAVHSLDSLDFYFENHQAVFRVLKIFHKEEKPVDTHLVSEELKKNNHLEKVGGVAYIIGLAQYAGTSAHVEEYIRSLKESSLSRKLLSLSRKIDAATLKESPEPEAILEEALKELETLKKAQSDQITTSSIQDRWKDLESMLNKYRGQKYIGLCQKRIPILDDSLLGLRKLILLAAQPNVGKTALTIQLSLDIIRNNPDACMVYFSLEMTARDILIRMCCHLAQMDYQTFVLGSGNQDRSIDPDAYFAAKELERIEHAKKELLKFGDRIQIIDSNMNPFIDSRAAINYINTIKEKTGCSRVIVIVDYLQVWPINGNLRFSSENEIDKWKVGEIKKIRDAINDDPIIVISEARKPSNKEGGWGDDMADVMGSARGTYTPDVVMLMSQLSDKALVEYAKKKGMKIEGHTNEDQANYIQQILSNQGKAVCRLKAPKVRDGMKRFNITLEYSFHRNTFALVGEQERNITFNKNHSNDQAQYSSKDGYRVIGTFGGEV